MTRQQILYDMFYDMRKQAHFSYVCPNRTALAMHSPGKPLWIWVREGMDEDKLRPFFYACVQNMGEPLTGLVAEPGAAMTCAALYAEQTPVSYIARGLAAYYLLDAVKPAADGSLVRSCPDDCARLAEWIGCFYREALTAVLPFEEQDRAARALAQNGLLYEWRDGRGEPAAMGMLSRQNDRLCRLNLIYTHPSRRGAGYGRAVTAALAGLARQKGLIPMLYTGAANIAANRMYTSLGFLEAGRLTEVCFTPAT